MNNESVSLADYVRVLVRRWQIIVVTVLLILGAVALYTIIRPPEYMSTAEVQVELPPESAEAPVQQSSREEELATQQYVATSEPVQEMVSKDLDREVEIDAAVAKLVPETRLLRITATDDNPTGAGELANSFARNYLAWRTDQYEEQTEETIAGLRTRQEQLQERLGSLQVRLANAAEGSSERRALSSEEESIQGMLERMTSQIVAQETKEEPAVGTITRHGDTSTDPVNPEPVRDFGVALAVALLLGVGLAFFRDHLDDTIYDEKVLRRHVGERPILGSIPRLGRRIKPGTLVTAFDPRAPASEAYQALSANVRGMLASGRSHRERAAGRSLLVTAASRREDTTSTAANVAIASARAGLRVLLVDTDLREPAVGERFGLRKKNGLANVLAGASSLEESVVDVGIRNLMVLPAGTPPPNPAELLAGPRMGAVLSELAVRSDLVVFDCGPVQLADPIELALRVDLVLLVVRAGRSRAIEVEDAVERLEHTGAPLAIACDGEKYRPPAR